MDYSVERLEHAIDIVFEDLTLSEEKRRILFERCLASNTDAEAGKNNAPKLRRFNKKIFAVASAVAAGVIILFASRYAMTPFEYQTHDVAATAKIDSSLYAAESTALEMLEYDEKSARSNYSAGENEPFLEKSRQLEGASQGAATLADMESLVRNPYDMPNDLSLLSVSYDEDTDITSAYYGNHIDSSYAIIGHSPSVPDDWCLSDIEEREIGGSKIYYSYEPRTNSDGSLADATTASWTDGLGWGSVTLFIADGGSEDLIDGIVIQLVENDN